MTVLRKVHAIKTQLDIPFRRVGKTDAQLLSDGAVFLAQPAGDFNQAAFPDPLAGLHGRGER